MTAGLPTLQERVEQYVAERRRLGFALRSEARQLYAFARFAADGGHVGPLTLDLAVRWATEPSRRGRHFPGRRIEVLRPFARACAAIDGASAVPPRGLVGPTRRRPLHHLYTAAQVTALLRATRTLGPAGGLRPTTYLTLFGVLAACGLRISEALRLERHAVDLARDLLVVRMTKFRKSRLVPLHPTTTVALRRYAAARDRLVPRPWAATFFVGDTGAPLPYATVRGIFRRLSTRLGWEAVVPRPRLHDFRHTLASQRLRQWSAQRGDVGARLAALATYLGHAHITDTYWYLTASPELLAGAARRFETFAAHGGTP